MQFLFALGLMLASSVLQALTQPKPTKPERASIGDFDFPQAKEGTPQIVIFGDCWITAWTVLWYGNLRTTAIKSKGGKK
jgi:hypothetical protein